MQYSTENSQYSTENSQCSTENSQYSTENGQSAQKTAMQHKIQCSTAFCIAQKTACSTDHGRYSARTAMQHRAIHHSKRPVQQTSRSKINCKCRETSQTAFDSANRAMTKAQAVQKQVKENADWTKRMVINTLDEALLMANGQLAKLRRMWANEDARQKYEKRNLQPIQEREHFAVQYVVKDGVTVFSAVTLVWMSMM